MMAVSSWRSWGLFQSAPLLLSVSTLLLLCLVHQSSASTSHSAEIETTGTLQAAEDRISFDGKYQDGEVELMGPDEPMQEESRQVKAIQTSTSQYSRYLRSILQELSPLIKFQRKATQKSPPVNAAITRFSAYHGLVNKSNLPLPSSDLQNVDPSS